MVEDMQTLFDENNLKQNTFLEHYQLSLVWFMAGKKKRNKQKLRNNEKNFTQWIPSSFTFLLLAFSWS